MKIILILFISIISFVAFTINEDSSSKLELINIVDILGRESEIKKDQILFYIYSNGTIEKKVVFE